MSPSTDTNKATVLRLLSNATDLSVVKGIVSPKATYVSLNSSNPELKRIEPWCGTHENAGPEAVHQTFVDVNRYWKVEKFDIHATIAEGSEVAVFGRFVYVSQSLGQTTDSPFAVLCRFDESEGKVVYMQFMEDTLSTANSFRKEARVVYQSNPDEKDEVVVEQ